MKRFLSHILVLPILASFLMVSCTIEMGKSQDDFAIFGSSLVFKGRVTDGKGTPVAGIQAAAEFVFADDQQTYRDTLHSDAEGYFGKFYSGMPEVKEAAVTFKDIDGEANGGRFETARLSFPAACLEKGEAGFGGSFEVVAEAKLSKAGE